jgi:hypothetical protein
LNGTRQRDQTKCLGGTDKGSDLPAIWRYPRRPAPAPSGAKRQWECRGGSLVA